MSEYPYPLFSEDGKVNCQLCGKPFLVIAPKHLETHGVTYSEYKLRFPDVPLSCEEFYTRSSYGKEKQIFVKETLDAFEEEVEVLEEPEIDDEIDIEEVLTKDKPNKPEDFCDISKDKVLDHLRCFFTNIRKDYMIQIFSPSEMLLFETISDFADPVLKINVEFPNCFWHNLDTHIKPNREITLQTNGWKVIKIKSKAPTFDQIKDALESS